MREFTSKERKAIELAYMALDYCASNRTSVAIEWADSLKYETGSRTAGRPRIWAKALMVDAYSDGRYGSTQDRRAWLSGALGVSRGIRFAYMLGCSNEFRREMEEQTKLAEKIAAGVKAYADCTGRPYKWPAV